MTATRSITNPIEVYKGPASTLFGRGSTGGVINQVLKSPQLFPIYDFALTAGNNGEARGTADVNYVLGDTSALRLNVMGQRNNQNGRPFARTQRWGVAPAIAFGIGTDTTFTLKYLHQQEDNIPDYGIPFLFGKPAPVAHDAYYGLPTDDRFKTDVDIVTGRFDHRFNDMFSISDTVRYGHYWFDSRADRGDLRLRQLLQQCGLAILLHRRTAMLLAAGSEPRADDRLQPVLPRRRNATQRHLRAARPSELQGHHRDGDEQPGPHGALRDRRVRSHSGGGRANTITKAPISSASSIRIR